MKYYFEYGYDQHTVMNFLNDVYYMYLRANHGTNLASKGDGIPTWIYNLAHQAKGQLNYDDIVKGFDFCLDKINALEITIRMYKLLELVKTLNDYNDFRYRIWEKSFNASLKQIENLKVKGIIIQNGF